MKTKFLIFLTLILLCLPHLKPETIIPVPIGTIKDFGYNPAAYFGDNFHTVQPGVCYRSKQLTGEKLEYYIKEFKLKTIINLRGENKEEKWWQEEKATADKNGVLLVNISFSASDLPTQENVSLLLQTFKTSPKPILLHCFAGADRTGLASALWVLEEMGGDLETAAEQLSPKYGHLKSFYPNMFGFLSLWEAARKTKTPTKVLNEYSPNQYETKKKPATNPFLQSAVKIFCPGFW